MPTAQAERPITSRDALRIAGSNKFKRWIPATAAEQDDERTAMARLSKNSYFIPNVVPKFKLDKAKPFFTIGSCFAREIEDALIERELDVITAGFSVDPELVVASAGPKNKPGSIRAILNKYSTASIYNELVRVLEPYDVPDQGLIEIEPGLWQDPHLSLLKLATKTVALQTRTEVTRVTSRIREAGSVFITLGLTETWQDMETKLYMNSGPLPAAMRTDKGRYIFNNRDILACLADVTGIVELINKHTTAQIILTVSPVPLGTTWTELDVTVANTHSKSVLRAVAGQVASQYANVDYFPSFEMVTLSPRALAYGDDQLHVRRPMVQQVMNVFLGKLFGMNHLHSTKLG